MSRVRRGRSGHTLLELLLVLLILGVVLSVAMPPVSRWLDRAAVRAARDELAAGLALTRLLAVSAAGATLVLDPAAGRFWTRTGAGTIVSPVDLRQRYRVRVDAGPADSVGFHFDALGIGRLTSRTIRIQRRDAEAGLTVSAYGRFRRW